MTDARYRNPFIELPGRFLLPWDVGKQSFPLRCRQSEFNGSSRKSDNLRSRISQHMSANHPLLFIQQYFADSVHAFILRHKTVRSKPSEV